MKSPDDPNPYAPPCAELKLAEDVPVRRPASVKWAIAFFTLSCLTMSILHYQLFPEHGWSLWMDHPLSTLQDLMRYLALLALVVGGRHPWVYWVATASLSLHLKQLLQTIFDYPRGHRIVHDTASLVSIWVLGVLIVFHFYRFACCRPSRMYFKVIPS